MDSRSLRASRIEHLHSQWLDLGKNHPPVGYCSARQLSDVSLFGYDEEGDWYSFVGHVRDDVFCYLQALVCYETVMPIEREVPSIVFDTHHSTRLADGLWDFGSWERRAQIVPNGSSIWMTPPLTVADAFGAQEHGRLFTRATNPNESQSESKNWHVDWLRRASDLAVQSHSFLGFLISGEPTDSWCKVVVDLLQIRLDICDLELTPFKLPSDAEVLANGIWSVYEDIKWDVFAMVRSGWIGLPFDVCTASAMALERLAEDRPMARPALSPQTLRNRLECGDDTLLNYAKLAGVVTPKRGGKTFEYPPESILRICDCIENKNATEKLKSNARELRDEYTNG